MYLLRISYILILSILYFNSWASETNSLTDTFKFINSNLDFEKQDVYYLHNECVDVICLDTNIIIPKSNFDNKKIKNKYPVKNILLLDHKEDTYVLDFDTLDKSIPFGHYYRQRIARIKINTEHGLNTWLYNFFVSDDFSSVQYMNIKVLKPNGNIVSINNEEILNIYPLFKHGSDDEFSYKLPSVEISDIIEIAYFSQYSKGLSTLQGVYFYNSNIPSKKTINKFVIPNAYKFSYKVNNGLNNPIINKDSSLTEYQFSADNIECVNDFSNSCIDNEFPNLKFIISYRNPDTLNLLNIYIDFFNRANRKLDEPESDIRWAKSILSNYNITNKYNKFYLLYNLLYKKYNNTYDIFGITHLSYTELLIIYVHLLNLLKIDYYLCLAKNKYQGKIDFQMDRNKDFQFMLMFFDNDSNKIFLHPYDFKRKFYMNEFPEYLNETKAIIIKQKNKTEIKKNIMNSTKCKDINELDINYVTLSYGNDSVNYLKTNWAITPYSGSKDAKYITKYEYSGRYASEKRNSMNIRFKIPSIYEKFNKINITPSYKIDTEIIINEETTYPFNFAIQQTGKLISFYKEINDSIISIPLGSMLNYHKIIYYKGRKMNILIPSATSSITNISIEYPKQINILNKEKLFSAIDNSTCSFKFSIEQPNSNSVNINTVYRIKKDLIPRTEFDNLNMINNLSDSVLNTVILIKLKK